MFMARRPPLRRFAALALAVHALVVLAGPALLHGFACSYHGAPHCLVCASVQSVSSAAENLAPIQGDRADAGAIVSLGAPRDGVSLPSPAVDRAPPSLG
jgi:hypothetical protein